MGIMDALSLLQIRFWAMGMSCCKAIMNTIGLAMVYTFGRMRLIGAKIDLGHCLNLMDVKACDILSQVYTVLKDNAPQLPENKGKLHYLDRLVINTANDFAVRQGVPYDTVRCAFPEGKPVFPGSSILDRSHIQIAVRQERAIKELFVVDIQTLTK